MSYMALYRKYRPNNFGNVVGQDTIVKILVNSIKTNHISHAYLFTGPRGTGKTSIAKIFAHAVNCQNFSDDLCEKCFNCLALKENDIDIVEIDAASNNGVDEIRTLRDNVKLMPSFCKYKIYIIDEVHMLSTGAFNALLKTLEEPPSHVIFILATTEPNKIPLTILSRCQRFDFNRVSNSDLVERMKYILKEENKELSEETLDYIAQCSDGCVRDSINLLDQVISLGKGKQTNVHDIDRLSGKISMESVLDLLKSICNSDFASILTISENFSREGKNLSDVINHLLTILRDIQVYKQLNDFFASKYKQKLSEFNIDSNRLLTISKILNELLVELKSGNNQKSIFEIYLLHVAELFSNALGNEIISDENRKIANNSNEKFDLAHKEENISKNIDAQMNLDKKDQIFTDSSLVNISQIHDIRINNVLAGANKEELKIAQENFDKINDYISSKKYNSLVQILNDSSIVVASPEILMIKLNDEGTLSIFNTKIKQIESFLGDILGKNYKIVGVSTKEWLKIREEFIFKKKSNIPYVIIEENSVKLEVSKDYNDVEEAAVNIFGQNIINIK